MKPGSEVRTRLVTRPPRSSGLTLHLLFRRLDVRHHPRHVHAVPVQVLQEDVRVPSSECASLGNNGEQCVVHLPYTSVDAEYIQMITSYGLNESLPKMLTWPTCGLKNTQVKSYFN